MSEWPPLDGCVPFTPGPDGPRAPYAPFGSQPPAQPPPAALALLMPGPRAPPPSASQPPFPSYDRSLSRGDNPREIRKKEEKQRRDKLNHSISELAGMVPPIVAANKKIDKTGVLRLTAHYLRSHQYVFGDSLSADQGFTAGSVRALLGLLRGFLLTTTYRGLVVVASPNIQQYLGYSELDLLGHSIFSIVHPDDQEIMRRQLIPQTLSLGPNGELMGHEDEKEKLAIALASEKRKFIVRFKKHTLRSEPVQYVSCTVEGTLRKSDGACSGYNRPWKMVRRARARGDNPCSSGNDVVFVGLVRPTAETFISEKEMDSFKMEYRTRHSVDGEIIQCEQRIALVTGYMTHEVNGVNALNFMHRDDVRWVIIALRDMYDQHRVVGESCYRLITKNGQFVYVMTRGCLDVEGDSKVRSFVCTNTVVEERDGKHLIQMMKKKFMMMLNNNEETTTEEEVKELSDSPPSVEDPKQLAKGILHLVTNLPSPQVDGSRGSSPEREPPPSLQLAIIPHRKERILSAIEKIYTVINQLQPSNMDNEMNNETDQPVSAPTTPRPADQGGPSTGPSAGATPGPRVGVTPGTSTGATPGTSSGPTPGPSAEATPGPSAEVTPGPSTGAIARSTARVSAEPTSGTSVDSGAGSSAMADVGSRLRAILASPTPRPYQPSAHYPFDIRHQRSISPPPRMLPYRVLGTVQVLDNPPNLLNHCLPTTPVRYPIHRPDDRGINYYQNTRRSVSATIVSSDSTDSDETKDGLSINRFGKLLNSTNNLMYVNQHDLNTQHLSSAVSSIGRSNSLSDASSLSDFGSLPTMESISGSESNSLRNMPPLFPRVDPSNVTFGTVHEVPARARKSSVASSSELPNWGAAAGSFAPAPGAISAFSSVPRGYTSESELYAQTGHTLSQSRLPSFQPGSSSSLPEPSFYLPHTLSQSEPLTPLTGPSLWQAEPSSSQIVYKNNNNIGTKRRGDIDVSSYTKQQRTDVSAAKNSEECTMTTNLNELDTNLSSLASSLPFRVLKQSEVDEILGESMEGTEDAPSEGIEAAEQIEESEESVPTPLPHAASRPVQ